MEITSVKWPSHVPFANGLLEGPFVKGFSCSLSFGTSLQMASPSRSALQGRKKAVWNLSNVFFLKGFWLNLLNKVTCSNKLNILSRYILRHKTHQLHHTRHCFKLLRFFKKIVANKLLNGTTGAVGDIQRHHAKQFIHLQYFPVVE